MSARMIWHGMAWYGRGQLEDAIGRKVEVGEDASRLEG
jgi:hypothetical protein